MASMTTNDIPESATKHNRRSGGWCLTDTMTNRVEDADGDDVQRLPDPPSVHHNDERAEYCASIALSDAPGRRLTRELDVYSGATDEAAPSWRRGMPTGGTDLDQSERKDVVARCGPRFLIDNTLETMTKDAPEVLATTYCVVWSVRPRRRTSY